MRSRSTVATSVILGSLLFSAPVTSLAEQSVDNPTPGRGSSASGPLDSRNIPHPEWTQVSGEVEQARRVSGQDKAERLLLKLKAIEGGPIIADLGDASKLQGLDFKKRDYIHVRGNMTQTGNTQVLLAQELIAEGKVIAISREGLRDAAAADIGVFGEQSSEGPPTPKSPAARGPAGERDSSPPSQ